MDDGTARIVNYGLVPVAGGFGAALQEYLRWTAPELIRAERMKLRGQTVRPTCTRYTDMYSFGILIFGK